MQAQCTDGFPGEHICPLNQCRTSLNTFLWKSRLYSEITKPYRTFPNTPLNFPTIFAIEVQIKYVFNTALNCSWLFMTNRSLLIQCLCIQTTQFTSGHGVIWGVLIAYIFSLKGIMKSSRAKLLHFKHCTQQNWPENLLHREVTFSDVMPIRDFPKVH